MSRSGLCGPIVHLPNFVSMSENGGPPSVTHRKETAGRPYVLFVGRLERLKGLHTILPIFQRYEKAGLWIAGTGTEEASLRAMAGGSPNVRFLGHQSGDDLERLYREAVAVIYPSSELSARYSRRKRQRRPRSPARHHGSLRTRDSRYREARRDDTGDSWSIPEVAWYTRRRRS